MHKHLLIATNSDQRTKPTYSLMKTVLYIHLCTNLYDHYQ